MPKEGVAPPEPSEFGIAAAAQESVAAVIGSIKVETPMDKAMLMQLQANAKASQQQASLSPLNTGGSKVIVKGRTYHVPGSVIDAPNFISVSRPDEALKRWWLFTRELSDDDAYKLTELAAKKGFGQKPLVWFGQKLYWILVAGVPDKDGILQPWLPDQDSFSEGFNMDDANRNSLSYQIIMETWGLDTGNAILNACQRANISVLGLFRLAAFQLMDLHQAEIDANKSMQAVGQWHRPKKEPAEKES